ncbi:MAG: hypothetical protein JXA57_03125 [Armatimonadetes bacterium]|nr:hypothetical protein [Armatimonadota bacterium]
MVTYPTPGVYHQHRVLADGDIYFLVNNSPDPFTGDFAFRASGKAELWNPPCGETPSVETFRKSGMSTFDLTFPPRNGRFRVFGW